MKIQTPESVVLRQCLDLLRLRGVVAWRNNTGAMHVDGRYVRFGAPGSFDIIGCLRGDFLGVECKRPGGKLTEAQQTFHEAITKAGGLVVVVSDVRQLQEFLEAREALP